MISSDPALAKIREAAAGIDRATQLWDATDTGRIDGCRQALEGVVATMREAQEIFAGATCPADVAFQAKAIKAATLRLERLLDAAAAFLGTVFPEMSGCAPVYGCAGTIAPEPVAVNPGVEA